MTPAPQDVLLGVARYPTCGAGVTRQPDRPQFAFIENPTQAGLRQIGFADDLARSISHRGWYCDTFEDSVFRGVVFQFPARNGRAVYVAGYADPWNDGAAFVELKPIYGDKIDSSYDAKDDARDAALAADGIAQKEAEDEREYDRAWQAGLRFAEFAESIETAKTELKRLLSERRKVKTRASEFPGLCGAIRQQVARLLDSIHNARRNMRELTRGDYGQLIFYPNERLRAAFCDGASLDAFPEL